MTKLISRFQMLMLFFSLSKTQDGKHIIFSEVRFLSQQIRLKDAK